MAAEIHAWNLGEGGYEARCDAELADFVVGGVEGCAGDFDEDLAGLEGCWFGDCGEVEDFFHWAWMGDLPCLHFGHCEELLMLRYGVGRFVVLGYVEDN